MRLVYDTGHSYHRSAKGGEATCAPGKAYKPRRPRPGEIRERRLHPCRVCYPTKRSPLRKVGRRGRAKAAAMAKVRPAVLARDGGRCVGPDRGLPDRCAGRLDPHHVKPSGRGGADEVDNVATLCRFHHDWLDDHPLEAAEAGLLLHSWE